MLHRAPPVVAITDGFGLHPDWSPDGARIAFSILGRIYVAEVSSGELRAVVAQEGASHPTWSPDGSALTYHAAGDGGRSAIWTVPASGKASPSQLTRPPEGHEDQFPAWSPSGDQIVFGRVDRRSRDNSSALLVVRSDGSGLTRLTAGHDDFQPEWSPSGKWVVFAANNRHAKINALQPGDRELSGVPTRRELPSERNVVNIAVGVKGQFPAWRP